MRHEVDFEEWSSLGKGNAWDLPSDVYSLWFNIYTQSSFEEGNVHKEFADALSYAYLDMNHKFTTWSAYRLSERLGEKLYSDYGSVGMKRLFEDK